MDATNTFPLRPASSYLNLTFVCFSLLSAVSIIASACDDAGTHHQNTTTTTIPSINYSQIDYSQNSNNNSTQTYKTYVKTACNATTYPSICYKSLYPYASKIESDPLKLCNTSLSLALKAARTASLAVSKILKSNNLTKIAEQVVHDCFDNLKGSMGEMQDSLKTLGHLHNCTDKNFAMSNIKTWVSAAITDDETCSDGFDGENNVDSSVRNKIRNIVSNVARMTSNALFFINHLSY